MLCLVISLSLLHFVDWSAWPLQSWYLVVWDNCIGACSWPCTLLEISSHEGAKFPMIPTHVWWCPGFPCIFLLDFFPPSWWICLSFGLMLWAKPIPGMFLMQFPFLGWSNACCSHNWWWWTLLHWCNRCYWWHCKMHLLGWILSETKNSPRFFHVLQQAPILGAVWVLGVS